MQTTVGTRRVRFLDTIVTAHVRHEDGADGVSILELWAAHGDSPPLHVHNTEDESFFVLEGMLRLNRAGEDVMLSAGEGGVVRSRVPHTYRVESHEGARFLVVTSRGDFERFVLAASSPGEEGSEPALSGPPTEEQQQALASMAAAHGIDLVGPPLA